MKNERRLIMKKDNKKLLLSVAVATALMSVSLQAGDIEKNLGAVTDAFTIDQPSGTELMRVDGGGNVGIAVATPTNKLDVNGKVRIRDLTGAALTDTIIVKDATGVLHDSGITLQTLANAISNAQAAVDGLDTDGDSIPNVTDTDDDNDGLSDVDEATAGTNPLIADTDGDGVNDGQEIIDGTNPLDPTSFTDPAPDPLPGNIVLDGGQVLFLASLADTDYTPYTAPTGPATLDTNQPADGVADTAVNIQGTLDTTGKTIGIPYTVTTNPVTLPAFTQTITIPANVTEDGVSRDVTFSYPEQASLPVGTGVILANIKTTAGTLKAKKLDIQTGVGDGSETILVNSNGSVTKSVLGYLMGTFTLALNAAGDTAEVQLRDVAGIPDRMMGQVDNNGNTNTHDFLYLPVTNPITGRTWLNNNLGANYANVNHASFNISQQATSETDHHAYGSLFQWGRQADGHELMTWIDRTTGVGTTASAAGQSATSVSTVGHFLTGSADWLSAQDDTLWASESSTNNVCPAGYRLPLNPHGENDAANELWVESQSWTSQNAAGAVTSAIALPMSGYRSYSSGIVDNEGNNGYYWSGSVESTHGRSMGFSASAVIANNHFYRGTGFPVRCIKD